MKDLAPYIERIEKKLNELELPTKPVKLYDPLRYFLQIGGKRIRPALVILGQKLFSPSASEAYPQALSIELFHNFTLIHDDIMDNAPLRRGQQTVHEKWNSNIGILSGDALLIKAYQKLAEGAGERLESLMEVFNSTALQVCEGQQMDMDFEERIDVTISEYIEMIRLKTSVLLGGALEIGAIMADASDAHRRAIRQFGENIGIAFQIKDDILDLYADPDKFGKQVGGDVIANKKTMLFLSALSVAGGPQLEVLKQLLEETNIELKLKRTKELFDHLNVRDMCHERMDDHYKRALNALDTIDVADQNKTALRSLAQYLIERDL
ncbi:MAG: polyprenyl synthetase family protein [Crocinitomicaceae bacterium]